MVLRNGAVRCVKKYASCCDEAERCRSCGTAAAVLCITLRCVTLRIAGNHTLGSRIYFSHINARRRRYKKFTDYINRTEQYSIAIDLSDTNSTNSLLTITN